MFQYWECIFDIRVWLYQFCSSILQIFHDMNVNLYAISSYTIKENKKVWHVLCNAKQRALAFTLKD